MEIDVAKSFGKFHSEFMQLSRKERRTLILWHVLSNEKERYQYQKSQQDAERRVPKTPPSSSTRKLRS